MLDRCARARGLDVAVAARHYAASGRQEFAPAVHVGGNVPSMAQSVMVRDAGATMRIEEMTVDPSGPGEVLVLPYGSDE